jgi:hypothetical protein
MILMRPIGEIVKDEIRELTPVVIYFFIALNVLGVTRTLLLRQYDITVSTFFNATIGALVVAKVVMVVGVLPFMAPFPRIPIIYNVAWRTLLYMIGAFIFQVLEEALPLLLKGQSLAPVWDHLWTPLFLVTQLWLVLLFFIFCTFREVFHIIGREKVREIFLGARSPRSA